MADEDDHVFDGLKFENPEASAILYEGILKKQSPQVVVFIRPWQERYVRLTQHALYYYRSKDLPFQGAIPLSAVASIEIDSDRYRFHLILDPKFGRTFSFASKKETFTKWTDTLIRAHEQARRLQRNVDHSSNGDSDGVTTNTASGGGTAAGKKFWKNDDKKSSGVSSQLAYLQPILPPQFLPNDWIGNSVHPRYTLFNVPKNTGLFNSMPNLCKEVFGSFKIQSEEQASEIGTVYTLGDDHYPMTYRSFLMHCVFKSNPNFTFALDTMELCKTLSSYPLFPLQITHGQTSDAVYAIYHPPVRQSVDSLFSWLEQVHQFPESIVRWIGTHLLLTFKFIHPMGLQLISLSPETIFFDGDGVVRIIDLLLSPALSTSVPEYTPPEVVFNGYESSTIAADFWRLGVLLYELSVGVPPIRSDTLTIPPQPITNDPSSQLDQEQYEMQIYEANIHNQLRTFNPNTDLQFPPTISPELKQLIMALLDPSPQTRLTDLNTIKTFPFFTADPTIQWSIDHLLSQPRPEWIVTNVIQKLQSSPDTPVNLQFQPPPIPLTRITANISKIRGLPRHVQGHRIHCNVQIDGESKRTKAARPADNSEVPGAIINDTLIIDDNIIFDVVHGGSFSPSSNIVIEIVSKDRENRGINGVIGVVLYPIRDLQNRPLTNTWLNIYDHNGITQGELNVELIWDEASIDVNESILSLLTDSSRSLPEWFGKPIAAPPDKLYSLIVDEQFHDTSAYTQSQMNMASGLSSQLLQANTTRCGTGTISSPSMNPRTPILLAAAGGSGGGGRGSGSGNIAPGSNSGATSSLLLPGSPPQFNLRQSPSMTPMTRGTSQDGREGSGSPMSQSKSFQVGSFSRRTADSSGRSSGNGSSLASASLPRGSVGESLVGTPSFSSGPPPHPQPQQQQQQQQQQSRSSLPSQQPPPVLPHHRQQMSGNAFNTIHMPPPPPSSSSQGLQQQETDSLGKHHHIPLSHSPSAPAVIPTTASSSSSSSSLHPESSLIQSSSSIAATTSPTPPPPPPPPPSPDDNDGELDPDEVPANWRPHVDKKTGDTFYYNKVTKKTTWSPPACAIALLEKKRRQQQRNA